MLYLLGHKLRLYENAKDGNYNKTTLVANLNGVNTSAITFCPEY